MATLTVLQRTVRDMLDTPLLTGIYTAFALIMLCGLVPEEGRVGAGIVVAVLAVSAEIGATKGRRLARRMARSFLAFETARQADADGLPTIEHVPDLDRFDEPTGWTLRVDTRHGVVLGAWPGVDCRTTEPFTPVENAEEPCAK